MACAIALNSMLSCTKGEQDSSEQTLRVMTFNIRYGTAPDKENSWQNRKSLVVEVIKNFAPDILGVQEALHFQLDELKTAFPNYEQVGLGRDNGKKRGEYTAIFYDSKRFNMLNQETFWFSETPAIPGSTSWGNDIPRICTWVHLGDQISNSEFYIYNVHWDHQSQPSREMSAKLLIGKIQSRDDTKDPFVLLGDFNAAEDNPAFRSLIENQTLPLKDSYRELYPHAENVGTFNGFEGKTRGPKIDAILLSNGLRTISAEIVRTSKDGRYPSDHFPVTAVIALAFD